MTEGLCSSCARGKHSHDRWTGKRAGTIAGTDAGCPFLDAGGRECRCPVRLPLAPVKAPHCPTCSC